MCNGKQAKIMLIMLKITDEAARGGQSGLRRPAEQRLGRFGHSWFAGCSSEAISSIVELTYTGASIVANRPNVITQCMQTRAA